MQNNIIDYYLFVILKSNQVRTTVEHVKNTPSVPIYFCVCGVSFSSCYFQQKPSEHQSENIVYSVIHQLHPKVIWYT